MNILLSAYHCAPNIGSESAVGWNYAQELARMNHKVVVITSDTRKPFYTEGSDHTLTGIEVIFYGLPAWLKRLYTPNTTSEHLYYLFWQIGIFFYCRKLIHAKKIDLIHHITLGSFRIPSLLWLYKIPFIFGPVGGGEDPPACLLKGLSTTHKIKEQARKWINRVFMLNPLYYLNLSNSKLILLKNQDSLKYIPVSFHHKCKIDIGIGVAPRLPAGLEMISAEQSKFRILYAGRLLYWKGIHLTLKALSALGEAGDKIEYTIVGTGADEQWLRQVAADHKIEDAVSWIPKVEQQQLFKMYQDYDILLFPSYHDSSGMVVLEAMSFGLPVICLDLGGPKEVVSEACGAVISTKNREEKEIIQDLASAIAVLLNDPDTLLSKSQAAVRVAQDYTWEKVVDRTYDAIDGALDKKRLHGSTVTPYSE